ncbi:hypothetical protein CPB84DRAFT_1754689 [Gymnopilus junonius]|uniref:Uncharacterized protein n=1 Tax=Gymnopilus junonius TaxID=109634 RepID=A0A9P5TEM5_GYMJU|nr:hypothetical protein CPB84DRAFT_1754689 [Gymnopilus junonius]
MNPKLFMGNDQATRSSKLPRVVPVNHDTSVRTTHFNKSSRDRFWTYPINVSLISFTYTSHRCHLKLNDESVDENLRWKRKANGQQHLVVSQHTSNKGFAKDLSEEKSSLLVVQGIHVNKSNQQIFRTEKCRNGKGVLRGRIVWKLIRFTNIKMPPSAETLKQRLKNPAISK